MEIETREKLRKWVEEFEKIDEETKMKEAEVWYLTALSILEEDKNFQNYIKREK